MKHRFLEALKKRKIDILFIHVAKFSIKGSKYIVYKRHNDKLYDLCNLFIAYMQ